MENKTEKRISPSLNYIITIILFSALILSLLASSFNLFKANGIASTIVEKTLEDERPANLQITIVKDSSCQDCYSVEETLKIIKSDNVNIEAENIFERTDEKATELISKYAIEKLPAFIITGEINKNSSLVEAWAKIGEVVEDAVVFKSAVAPYVQADSGEIRGKVQLITIADASCKDCSDAKNYKGLPTSMGMSIEDEKTVEFQSIEGKRLIEEYNIKSIPTIIITGDLQAYPSENLKRYGELADDNFVLTQLQPPYVDTANGRLVGKINLTILSDKSCSECYDVAVYDNIIKQFGLFVQTKKTVDVGSASGKSLVQKYKIEAVPSIIMTGDVEVYNRTGSVWSGIGTTESDGTYVVREDGVKQLGVYKNLTTGEVVKP